MSVVNSKAKSAVLGSTQEEQLFKTEKSRASLVGGSTDLRELALCVRVSRRRTFQDSENNLLKATKAIKPVMGEYFRKSEEPICKSLWRSCFSCHFVSDTGSKVYYTSNKKLAKN